jgi:phage protein D/phage baseplate assembly protein gpV
MPNFVSITNPIVKIDGAVMSQDFLNDIIELVVDTSLHLPSMFSIRLHDPELAWANDSSLDIGKSVEIEFETTPWDEESSVRTSVIKAEITALEPDFSAEGLTTMTLRGYDKSHRLHRGRQTRTFLQVKDSDLAQTIAGEAGLSAQVDATTVTYEYVLQSNQTNMEFLRSRAERNGYQVFAADGNLYFKKGDFTLGDGPTLTFMDDLFSFHPCYTAGHQADKMTVRSWDPKQKQAISSQKTPNAALNQGGYGQTGGAKASSAFGSAEEVIVDRPVFTADEATAFATGLSDDISREFVQAEGVCDGDPRVKAGWSITIQGVASRFSGKYFVTSATHVWSGEGYRTRFGITGRQPNTLSYLLDPGNGHDSGQGIIQGVVPALVTNIDDPDDLGRVKVKYPWIGDNLESHWIRIASPMAGPQRGFYCLPEVDDEVLIAFEHGDVHRPYIVGALWNNTDKPPKAKSEAIADGKVIQRVLKTRAGHLIVLSDKQGEEQISITSKSGHTVILDDKSGSENITIKDKTGSNSMVIDSTKKSMTIEVGGDFTVTAQGKISLTSSLDLSLKAGTAGKFEATSELGLKGTASAKLENGAGAKVALQGPMVSIN